MQEQNVIGIDHLDTPIYRIFTAVRLKEVLDTHTLTLVKPRMWDNPYENFLLNANVCLPEVRLILQ